jgi:hypothetical protein
MLGSHLEDFYMYQLDDASSVYQVGDTSTWNVKPPPQAIIVYDTRLLEENE